MRGFAFAVGAVALLTCRVEAQQCDVAGKQLSSGDYEITPSTCNPVELTAIFSSSKGAYASAQVFATPVLKGPAVCAGLAGNNSCLHYTGACAANAKGGGCPPDPNAEPGEISCWCKKPYNYSMGKFAAASKPVLLSSELWIDKDLDGVADAFRYSLKAKNNGSQFMRAYPLFPQLYRFEWEDLNPDPDGDYNDYISYIQVRDCGIPSAFPSHLRSGEHAKSCEDACGDNSCPPGWIENIPLRFSASIGMDSLHPEGDREARGRMLHLAVAAYFAHQSSHDVAVCPVLLLRWPKSRMPGETTDLRTDVRYGGSQCGRSVPPDGFPHCIGTSLDPTALPISFAAEQHASPNCARSFVGSGDELRLEGTNAQCGAAANVQSYELPFDLIDGAIADPKLRYGAMSELQFQSHVIGVKVFVFEDIQSAQFHCPSGVNVLFHSSDPATAKSYSSILTAADRNLSFFTRQ